MDVTSVLQVTHNARELAGGSGLALGAGVLTWFGVVWLIGRFHGSELSIQAATGIPALIVLLIVMNWFIPWTAGLRRKS